MLRCCWAMIDNSLRPKCDFLSLSTGTSVMQLKASCERQCWLRVFADGVASVVERTHSVMVVVDCETTCCALSISSFNSHFLCQSHRARSLDTQHCFNKREHPSSTCVLMRTSLSRCTLGVGSTVHVAKPRLLRHQLSSKK